MGRESKIIIVIRWYDCLFRKFYGIKWKNMINNKYIYFNLYKY